jgi:hypothetical protein
MAYLRQNNKKSKTLITELDLEEDDQFPYISQLVEKEEPTHRAFHHIMKTQIGADEYLTKDMREKIGLNAEDISNKENKQSIIRANPSTKYMCVL